MSDMKKYTHDLLASLHGTVIEGLAKKIASGEASSADYSNAIRMLKDNNISQIAEEGDQLSVLQETLAQAGENELPSLEELSAMSNVESLFGEG